MPKPALADQARSGRQQPRRRSRRGQEERWQSRNLSVCNFCCRESASNRCAPGWHCYKAMLVMNTTWLWPMDRRRCSDGAAAGARHAGAGLVQQQRVRVADERDGQAQLAPAAAAVRLRRPGRHLLRAATLPKSYPALMAAALPARARAVHAHPRLACAPGSTWSGCMGAGTRGAQGAVSGSATWAARVKGRRRTCGSDTRRSTSATCSATADSGTPCSLRRATVAAGLVHTSTCLHQPAL